MNYAELIVFIAYFLFMLGIGLYFYAAVQVTNAIRVA